MAANRTGRRNNPWELKLRLVMLAGLCAGQFGSWGQAPAPAIRTSVPEVSAPTTTPADAASDARRLPADVAELPEILDARTANSATFRRADGRLVTILSETALHYAAEDGQWAVIDPAFRPYGDSFAVQHNSVRSRSGLRQAWLSAAAGEATITWQAHTLGAVTAAGDFVPLASALAHAARPASASGDGRRVDYTGAWSQASLSEALISAPGSIEHLLVLAEAPESGAAQFLELRAVLQLLPGASLWAGGQPVSDPLVTAGALTVYGADGNAALVFDPVLAFERDNPAAAVAGEYVLTPTADPRRWEVGMRTPLRWWTDPARRYPAVLDPTIRVARSTGFGDGLGWVRSTGDKAYTVGGIRLGAHLPDWNTQTRGYVQFNSLPALLTQAPVSLTTAYLDVEPALPAAAMPYYTNSPVDWEHKVIQRNTSLYYVGACPDEAACNNLSLLDNRLSDPALYNWDNSPAGTLISSQPLEAGPASGGGQPVVTTWDVTTQLQAWYAQWFSDTSNRPGPTFRLSADTPCPVPGPYYFGFQSGGVLNTSYQYVPQCTWFDLPLGSVRLRLEYNPPHLGEFDNPLNIPGVPSYLEDVLHDTGHQYALDPLSGFWTGRWRAVAVRGNHNFIDFGAGQPTRANLKLWDNSTAQPQLLANAAAPGPDLTTFLLIDDHNPGASLAGANLVAEVTASSENAYAGDLGRNYRINYVPAYETLISYGAWSPVNITLQSDQLIALSEFTLNQGDNVLIRTTTPLSLEVAFVEPSGASAVLGANDSRVNTAFFPADSVTRTLSIGSLPVTGRWAVAVVNQSLPISGDLPGDPIVYNPSIEIMACPAGSIPTARFNCQPLRLPDDSTPPSSQSVPVPGGGSVTVYSEGGFTATGTVWCTTNESQGAPIIGPVFQDRWVFVAQGSVCRNGATLTTTLESAVGLAVPVASFNPADKRGQYPPTFIYGDTGQYPLPPGLPHGQVTLAAGGDLLPLNAATRHNIQPFVEFWEDGYTAGTDKIATSNMQALAIGALDASMSVDAALAPYSLHWDLNWLLYPTPAGWQPQYAFLATLNQAGGLPMPLALASLEVRALTGGMPTGQLLDAHPYIKASGPSVFQIANPDGRVTLPDALGGASRLAQVIVQPPGLPRQPENTVSCSDGSGPLSCLDLRRGEYDWANGEGEKGVLPWELPDVHLEEGLGSVMFSREGQLNIFSADHPFGAGGLAQTFSFDTWEATVVVRHAACQPGGPVTTVVAGSGSIALPMLGDDGSGPPPWVQVDFTLCETKLRQAMLELAIAPPGLPVGNSGLGVNVIGGTVTVGPGSTEIKLQVDFQTLDMATLTGGEGIVTINAAGLFELQAKGTVVGVVSADNLTLQVAWNPLDVLFDATASYSSLLSGHLRLHGWIGQGWQGKYSWLPNNGDFHFTGSIEATVKIKTGALIDEWVFKLPPFTVSLSAEVAFGEFCTSAGCANYDWGMSATVDVLGYDVGVYVDSSGPDLILGSNSHQLIDQAGATGSAQALAPGLVEGGSPPPPVIQPGVTQEFLSPAWQSPIAGWPSANAASQCTGLGTGVHTCPFTVTAGTGRALFVANWQNGALDVALVKPDNTVVTAVNAAAEGVVISATSSALTQQVSFSAGPTTGTTLPAGVWRLRLGNVGQGLLPGFSNNYRLLFAADPPAPVINWTAPAGQVVPNGSGIVNLAWNVTRGGQPIEPGLKLELFYVPAGSQPITPTAMAGTLLASQVAAEAGAYAWDTRGLASGTYAVGARLDDHLRGNGHVVAWAAGTVVINDNVPPPVPVLHNTIAVDDALIVLWNRDDLTPDLAGYQVEYTIPAWDLATPLARVRRVLPHSPMAAPLYERVRLGGVLLSQPGYPPVSTSVCVRAYDASGNVSGCATIGVDMPEVPEPPVGVPALVSATYDGTVLRVLWDPPRAAPAGYLVSLRPLGCGPRAPAPPTPVDAGNTTEHRFVNLTEGAVYRVAVHAYAANGLVGVADSTTVLAVTPADGNADGLPDAWAALYGISDPAADPDADGLTNADELAALTVPTHADSDGDAFYDGEEIAAHTDPCGPDRPPHHARPRLALVGEAALSFVAAANYDPDQTEALQILNLGAGALAWSARTSAAWITLSQAGGTGNDDLFIGADPSGLAPGVYTGVVTITGLAAGSGAEGTSALVETATVAVQLVVLPLQQFTVRVPLVGR